MKTRTPKGHFLGWKPQLPDHRDLKWSLPLTLFLPPLVDLRKTSFMPQVYDQGDLGSCTANAICSAFEFQLRKQGLMDFMASRLFVYWNERDMEGDTDEDNGANIRDGFKSIQAQGVCMETSWPYDISKFTVKPTEDCYIEALKNEATQYQSVQCDLNHLKGCLADGFPFVMGITLYESFESDYTAKTGYVTLPGQDENVLGGHAVKCVGYSDAQSVFIVKNSWGTGWGDGGYFYLPYDYLVNLGLGSDFWTIRLVE